MGTAKVDIRGCSLYKSDMAIEDVRARINLGIGQLNEAPDREALLNWEACPVEHVRGLHEELVGAVGALAFTYVPDAVEKSMQTAASARSAYQTFQRAAEGAVRADPSEMLGRTAAVDDSATAVVGIGSQIGSALERIKQKLAEIGPDIQELETLHSAASAGTGDAIQAAEEAKQAAATFRDSL
jgi:hypothetical protein